MIKYNKIGVTFTVRAVGMLIVDNKLLVHKLANDEYWTLPGGRVDINEPSFDAVQREFKEELQVNIQANKLRFIAESFFSYNRKRFHEISFIYDVIDTENGINKSDFEAHEGRKHYLFKWIPLSEIKIYDIKPDFISSIYEGLPSETQHKIFEN